MTAETIDFESLPIDKRLELAICLDEIKGTRQVLFQAMRKYPELEYLAAAYAKADESYAEFAAFVGDTVLPPFDTEAYEESRGEFRLQSETR